ncbi:MULTISPECIES: DUF2478 domain-containing protein [unclassified Paracoccus (in: a-proteobacteria)]|uniref:DUF2478 domain-containing protein n=1 Tax=unclassified Paracoccus (in: a-proteobacteria) TaxID=2688777 RepID=UPI001600F3ED|nr:MULTISPECIES: DUF2478 domain-containing protein [unclassified Paracoccus (in: a-proteobacteria)]MBB1491535.1 DUF2478 domain-containing protein [Paracoccus sp. MC1854]MBB1497580.1 DUF2478 domain-containing protein [Paracoccus sp. MC1862]QQO44029.1 DUF2478 domain-containing protein [Paracoccus sp. MC1862]
MLGYVIHDEDDGNARMAALACRLAAQGLRLAGAVQANLDRGGDCACDMELTVLGTDAPPIRISQSLGAGAQGCRLDTDALERAAALAARGLEGADLALVNKFGKQEAAGRGFRDFIADALANGTPVLVAVAPELVPAFIDFAGDYARPLTWAGAEGWCRSHRAAA